MNLFFPEPVDATAANRNYIERIPTGTVNSAKDWNAFSVAETLAGDVDPAWSVHKDSGNAKLAKGDYAGAAQMYKHAALNARYGDARAARYFDGGDVVGDVCEAFDHYARLI